MAIHCTEDEKRIQLFNENNIITETIRQWLVLIFCGLAILVFLYSAVRARLQHKMVTFDSVILVVGSIKLIILLIDTFVVCNSIILFYYFSVQSFIMLFVFYKFVRLGLFLVGK